MSHDSVDVSDALAWAQDVLGPLTAVAPLEGGVTSTMLAVTAASGDRAVLRLMTREPWRAHGEALTTREHQVQQLLAATSVPAPRSLALDASGNCGHPAHLMTRLPGAVDVARVDDSSRAALAELLAAIHAVPPADGMRTYQSWAWEAKYVVPRWAARPHLWATAFDLLRTPPPAYERRFLHRDFGQRNVLWQHGRITGVVDWVETSLGPAWLDVAHCCTTIALVHGTRVADMFAEAYVGRTGLTPAPYYDVMDVVGCLPAPGRPSPLLVSADHAAHLEERLAAVLRRV